MSIGANTLLHIQEISDRGATARANASFVAGSQWTPSVSLGVTCSPESRKAEPRLFAAVR